jgi:hypothetical protein
MTVARVCEVVCVCVHQQLHGLERIVRCEVCA